MTRCEACYWLNTIKLDLKKQLERHEQILANTGSLDRHQKLNLRVLDTKAKIEAIEVAQKQTTCGR